MALSQKVLSLHRHELENKLQGQLSYSRISREDRILPNIICKTVKKNKGSYDQMMKKLVIKMMLKGSIVNGMIYSLEETKEQFY